MFKRALKAPPRSGLCMSFARKWEDGKLTEAPTIQEYLATLYWQEHTPELREIPTEAEPRERVTMEELEAAVRALAKNKAAGVDALRDHTIKDPVVW